MCGRINSINGHVVPGQPITVITRDGTKKSDILGHAGGKIYNRRIEKLVSRDEERKQGFKRVLVPFESFTEKSAHLYKKKPGYYLGGIENKDGEVAIITMEPSERFKRLYHHRRPIIVTSDWLDQDDLRPVDPGVVLTRKAEKAVPADEAVAA